MLLIRRSFCSQDGRAWQHGRRRHRHHRVGHLIRLDSVVKPPLLRVASQLTVAGQARRAKKLDGRISADLCPDMRGARARAGLTLSNFLDISHGFSGLEGCVPWCIMLLRSTQGCAGLENQTSRWVARQHLGSRTRLNGIFCCCVYRLGWTSMSREQAIVLRGHSACSIVPEWTGAENGRTCIPTWDHMDLCA